MEHREGIEMMEETPDEVLAVAVMNGEDELVRMVVMKAVR